MFEFITSFFGSTPEEPLCKAADMLCSTLEGYGYEVHSPDILINAAQAISDRTGLSEHASYIIATTGLLAKTVIVTYYSAKMIMNRLNEETIPHLGPHIQEVITDVKLSDTSDAVALVVKPSHQQLVDGYNNVAAKAAVKNMKPDALAVFNELSEGQVIAFGRQLGQALLKFQKMDADAQIEALQALEGADVNPTVKFR